MTICPWLISIIFHMYGLQINNENANALYSGKLKLKILGKSNAIFSHVDVGIVWWTRV